MNTEELVFIAKRCGIVSAPCTITWSQINKLMEESAKDATRGHVEIIKTLLDALGYLATTKIKEADYTYPYAVEKAYMAIRKGEIFLMNNP